MKYFESFIIYKKEKFSQHNVYKLGFNGLIQLGLGQERDEKGMQFNI